MGNLIYRTVSGSVAQLHRLDVLSNNLAHANTVGFKADRATFSEALDANQRGTRFVSVPKTTIDTTPGPLEVTDNPFDLGIAGDGYFVVDAPQGQRLTRVGTFTPDTDGTLRNVHGHALLGEGGQPVQIGISAESGPVTVSETGQLIQDEKTIGKLMLVNAAPGTLTKDGQGLLRLDDGMAPQPDPNVAVRQGTIEESNVNPVSIMTELVTVHRHFDALQQAIKVYRDMDEASGRRLRS